VGRGRRNCKIGPSALLSAVPYLLTATMSETGGDSWGTEYIPCRTRSSKARLDILPRDGMGLWTPAKIIIKRLYLSILLRRATLPKDPQWRKKSPSTASPTSSIPLWKVLHVKDDGRIKRSRTSVKVVQIIVWIFSGLKFLLWLAI
jgi:hypothetical protein